MNTCKNLLHRSRYHLQVRMFYAPEPLNVFPCALEPHVPLESIVYPLNIVFLRPIPVCTPTNAYVRSLQGSSCRRYLCLERSLHQDAFDNPTHFSTMHQKYQLQIHVSSTTNTWNSSYLEFLCLPYSVVLGASAIDSRR